MHRAMVAIGQTIRAQATFMGYADCFALLGGVLLCAIFAIAMLKGAAAAGGAHRPTYSRASGSPRREKIGLAMTQIEEGQVSGGR